MDEEIRNEEAVAEEPEVEAAEKEEATIETEIPTEQEESIGNIKISVDVVSTIAGIAASEIEGVSCMYTSFAAGVAKRFGAKRNASQGVKVDMNADSVSVDLYIVVEYGVKIPELAWSIQENVKTNVESMTGLNVSKVNIHIEGISFDKEEAVEDDVDEISD